MADRTNEDLETYIDATAKLMALPIAPEHRPGVVQFFGIAKEMADLLDGADLDPHELAFAPVYAPPAVPEEPEQTDEGDRQ